MNWDIIKGKWKQGTGRAREEWAELTDDEWGQVEGNRDQFVGKVQEKYGIARDEAERRVDDWADRHFRSDD